MTCANLLLRKELVIGLITTLLVANSLMTNVYAVLMLEGKNVVFQLHILKKNRDQLKLQGKPEDWNILKEIDLFSESMFIITENDIESYNWPDQLITLTPEGSMNLLNLGGKNFSAKVKKELYLNLESSLESAVFIIVLEDKKLYGGTFSNRISTRGTYGPTIFPQIVNVIDVDPLQLQIGFVIRPLYTLNVMLSGYKALDTSLKNRIEIPKMRDFFRRVGKLTSDDSPNRVESWIPKLESTAKE